ncbi:MAG: hypothetical protein IJ795_02000 [Bacteroidales bacterium]|nr:hypothetical protein [Bacteroidales bacterium]
MRNKLFGIAALMILAGACSNPSVEVKRNVEISIRLSTVLSGFVPYASDNLDMYSDSDGSSKVRVSCYMYDKEGHLTDSHELMADNFSAEINLTETVPDDYSTFVILASCIQGSLDSPIYEAYTISGIQSLGTLEITQQSEKTYSSSLSVLGYAVVDFDSSNQSVNIDVKPATALVYLNWRDIHSHDNDGASDGEIYGYYSAKATDYWEKKTYNWTMSVEPGASSDAVVLKEFEPALFDAELFSDKGYNTYNGSISSSTLTIPMRQKTGFSDDDGDVLLMGGTADGEYITFEDIKLSIGAGTLTTENMFGITVPNSNSGWYSLFNPGVVYTKTGGAGGIDKYYIIYHNNDKLDLAEGRLSTATSLSSNENNAGLLQPADYPSSTKNVYTMVNFLPGTFNVYGRSYVGNTNTDYNRMSFTAEAGHQYVIAFDCNSLSLYSYEGALGSKAADDEFIPTKPVKTSLLVKHLIPIGK